LLEAGEAEGRAEGGGGAKERGPMGGRGRGGAGGGGGRDARRAEGKGE